MSQWRQTCARASALALLFAAACGRATDSPSGRKAAAPAVDTKPDASAAQSAGDSKPNAGEHARDVAGMLDGLRHLLDDANRTALPKDIVPGAACPDPGPDVQSDIDAQASATIPLKTGLTLSYVWTSGTSDATFDHECLTQVTRIEADGVHVSSSCSEADGKRYSATRRLCRADLRAAPVYHTAVTYAASALPLDTLVGTTMFSLPSRTFADLKRSGRARHHYVQILTHVTPPELKANYDGVLDRHGRSTMSVIVNDRAIELPVIRAAGSFDGMTDGRKNQISIGAAIVDDERFPLVLDYAFAGGGFAIRYSKISFPTGGELERRLSVDEPVDVYGIYFDFASDKLRPESEPVLLEISQVLENHPDWTLTVTGHTDNIGGDVANVDLSKRRAAAVRDALAAHYHVDGNRLRTGGYGASRPKDTNATPEGRARNRRVELVRHSFTTSTRDPN